jgi:hypothetical protein
LKPASHLNGVHGLSEPKHVAKGRFVACYRVSTARQGRSGLGLEGQRAAVINYLDGGRWTLVAEFTEVESGANNGRPELAKALAACRLNGRHAGDRQVGQALA